MIGAQALVRTLTGCSMDAPLESGIDALAGSVSTWVQRPACSAGVAIVPAPAL